MDTANNLTRSVWGSRIIPRSCCKLELFYPSFSLPKNTKACRRWSAWTRTCMSASTTPTFASSSRTSSLRKTTKAPEEKKESWSLQRVGKESWANRKRRPPPHCNTTHRHILPARQGALAAATPPSTPPQSCAETACCSCVPEAANRGGPFGGSGLGPRGGGHNICSLLGDRRVHRGQLPTMDTVHRPATVEY